MDIANLPALNMISNAAFSQVYGYMLTDETEVDLSDWVGEAVFSRDTTPILTVALALGSDGTVKLDLTAAQVNMLVGPRVNFQINLTPTGFSAPTDVWRGHCVVQ